MSKNHRTRNAFSISLALHLLFIFILGFFIKTPYEPVEFVMIEWVKVLPIAVKLRPTVREPLPIRGARKSLHEIPQVKFEGPEIVQESVEINLDAKVSEILPAAMTSVQFEPRIEPKETIDLPAATSMMVEAPGRGRKTNRVRAAGTSDGSGSAGNEFLDIGPETPRIIEIDSSKPTKKDVFGIGEYLEKTRRGSQQVIYVLDVSSSMRRKRKLYIAVQELKNTMARLKKDDYFNIITFDSNARIYSTIMLSATLHNLRRAHYYLDNLITNRGTNLSEALKLALAFRASTIIIISDGQPSKGIIDNEKLLALVRIANIQNTKIMSIALGEKRIFKGVTLLRRLSAENHGQTRLINIR